MRDGLKEILSASLAILALSGCAGREPMRSTAQLTVIDGASELPAPMRGDLVAPDRQALIGPLDSIGVEVFNVENLNREMLVDAGGRISMPLIGTIEAGGKTAGELARDIEAALGAKYIRDPQVTVNILGSVSQVVTVDGEVAEPGLYPVTNQTTLLRAIASAKGMTEFARADDVVVLRTVEGQRMAALYNVAAIRRGVYRDPALYANDLVIVGDSPQRRLFRDVVSIAPLAISPLVAILRR